MRELPLLKLMKVFEIWCEDCVLLGIGFIKEFKGAITWTDVSSRGSLYMKQQGLNEDDLW